LFVNYTYDSLPLYIHIVHTPYPAVARAKALFGTEVDLGDRVWGGVMTDFALEALETDTVYTVMSYDSTPGVSSVSASLYSSMCCTCTSINALLYIVVLEHGFIGSGES
jgi:hypothetical protein